MMNTKKWTALDLVQIALVAALYVALTMTPPLNTIAYGAYQFLLMGLINSECQRCSISLLFIIASTLSL